MLPVDAIAVLIVSGAHQHVEVQHVGDAAGGDEDDVDGVASGAGEEIAAETAVLLRAADHWIDPGAPPDLAANGRLAFTRQPSARRFAHAAETPAGSEWPKRDRAERSEGHPAAIHQQVVTCDIGCVVGGEVQCGARHVLRPAKPRPGCAGVAVVDPARIDGTAGLAG